MRAILTTTVIATSLLTLIVTNAQAATTITMRIADKDGQSSIIHPGDFTLLTVGQSLSSTSSGKPVVGSIAVTKRIDEASGKLMRAASQALHFQTGRISIFGDSERLATFEIEMEDVMIDSINTSVGLDGVPVETLSFSCATVKWSYIPIVEGGSQPGKTSSVKFNVKPASPSTAPKPPAVTAPSAAQKANAIATPSAPPSPATTFNSAATSLMRVRSRSTDGTVIVAKVDGLIGFSTQPNHLGELTITSFSWGGAFSYAGLTPTNASITKGFDLATMTIILKCLNRTAFSNAVVTFIKAGATPTDYMKVTFTNPRIDSVTFSASEESGIGESLSLSYDAVHIDNKEGSQWRRTTWGKSNVPKKW